MYRTRSGIMHTVFHNSSKKTNKKEWKRSGRLEMGERLAMHIFSIMFLNVPVGLAGTYFVGLFAGFKQEM